MAKRRRFTAKFKAEVVLEVLHLRCSTVKVHKRSCSEKIFEKAVLEREGILSISNLS